MSVDNTLINQSYVAGSTTYTIPFKLKDDDDLVVSNISTTGVVTNLTKDVDYTVATNFSTITMVAPSSWVGTMMLWRDTVKLQSTVYVEGDRFPAKTHEAALDNLELQIQEAFFRALKESLPSGVYDAVSKRIVNIADPTNGQDAATKNYVDGLAALITTGSVVPLTWAYTGDGSTTQFSIPGASTDITSIYIVTIDGVLQTPSSDYLINSSTDLISFLEVPYNGAQIYIRANGFSAGVSDAATLRADLASYTDANKGYNLVGITKTLAEITAGVTIVNAKYPVGDIRRYGADSTGVASSNTAFANAALVGGDILVKDGTYLTSGFTLAVAGTRLIGSNATIKASQLNSPARLITITASGVVISGIKINGNSYANDLIYASGAYSNLIVENCELYAGGASGQITMYGVTRPIIRGNIIRDSAGTGRGMWIGNYVANGMVTDILIADNHVYGNAATAIVCAANGGTVTGNMVADNVGSGIIYGGYDGYRSTNLAIVGNTCTGNGNGIQCDTIYATAADLPFGITITGNVCYNNNGDAGIYVPNTTYTTVSGNVCYDNDQFGIVATDNCAYVAIVGNVCWDSRSAGSRTQDKGIQVGGGQYYTVSGNVIYNHVQDGIMVETSGAGNSCGAVVVTGNVSRGNSRDGIIIAETDAGSMNAVVDGNFSDGNTRYDLNASALYTTIGTNRYTTENAVQYKNFTDADTTPSVKGRRLWRAANTGATVITTFDDGIDGQEIVIYATNGNTTINHGATVVNKSAANVTLAGDQFISYLRQGTVWRELFRSF